MSALHPHNAFRHPDMDTRRDGTRIVVGRALYVDESGKHLCIRVLDSCPAVPEELPATMP
jgi:hypothetical protein